MAQVIIVYLGGYAREGQLEVKFDARGKTYPRRGSSTTALDRIVRIAHRRLTEGAMRPKSAQRCDVGMPWNAETVRRCHKGVINQMLAAL